MLESDEEIDVLEHVGKLIVNSEKHAEDRLTEVTTKTNADIAALRATVSSLQTRVESLQQENDGLKQRINRSCNCRGLFETIQHAGMNFFGVNSHVVNDQYVFPEQTTLNTGVTMPNDDLTHTSNQLITFTEPVETFVDCVTTPTDQSTSTYKQIKDVPDHLRAKLLPFSTDKSPKASNDKCNALQRAYFRWKMVEYDTIKNVSERGKRIHEDGMKDLIWSLDDCFAKYIRTRVKNEMNFKRLKEMESEQAKRFKRE